MPFDVTQTTTSYFLLELIQKEIKLYLLDKREPAASLCAHCPFCASLAHSQQTSSQEKPPTSLATGKPAKAGGVRRSQATRGSGRPSPDQARHGTANALGTAQGKASRMGERFPGIPPQLRQFEECQKKPPSLESVLCVTFLNSRRNRCLSS